MLSEGYIDESVKTSIEAPLRAQAATKEAEADLLKKQVQAKQKVVDAEADAQALTIRAEAEAKANRIVAQSLTGELVQLRSIEKLNPNVQVMYVPNNTTLVQGMPGLTGKNQ